MLLIPKGLEQEVERQAGVVALDRDRMHANLDNSKQRALDAVTGVKPVALSLFAGIVCGAVMRAPNRPRLPLGGAARAASRMGLAYLAARFW